MSPSFRHRTFSLQPSYVPGVWGKKGSPTLSLPQVRLIMSPEGLLSSACAGRGACECNTALATIPMAFYKLASIVVAFKCPQTPSPNWLTHFLSPIFSYRISEIEMPLEELLPCSWCLFKYWEVQNRALYSRWCLMRGILQKKKTQKPKPPKDYHFPVCHLFRALLIP